MTAPTIEYRTYAVAVQGQTGRSYVLHAPVGVASTTPVPLVVCLHGSGSDQIQVQKATRWTDQSNMVGWAVAYGISVGDPAAPWNAVLDPHRPDDTAYLAAVVADAGTHLAVDPARVYIVGHSAGAAMTQTMVAVHSALFAAFAVVSGPKFPSRATQAAATAAGMVPGWFSHGTSDSVIPYSAGQAAVDWWTVHNKALTPPVVTDPLGPTEQDVALDHYQAGASGAEVLFYSISGGSHAWPRPQLPAPDGEMDGTALQWDFFQSHRGASAATPAVAKGASIMALVTKPVLLMPILEVPDADLDDFTAHGWRVPTQAEITKWEHEDIFGGVHGYFHAPPGARWPTRGPGTGSSPAGGADDADQARQGDL